MQHTHTLDSFRQLGLSQEVIKVIEEQGFTDPTDIQRQSVPFLLGDDRDFIGLAQTGTGKTAAFGWPLLERIESFDGCTQALILAPTRELGQQIAQQLDLFGKYLDHINILAVYGGAPISRQIKALRQPQHIIIATPGRLLDLINRKSVNLRRLRFLVLDEADEMLNMGFKEDLDKILSYTPASKLTWLFSATMPREIRQIVKTYMRNPIEAKIKDKNQVNVNIAHKYVIVRRGDKVEALKRCMDVEPNMRGVIFCRTRRDAKDLAENLLVKGYGADAIHGDLSQQQRDRVMRRFRSQELQVLVATDVAARGIDVDDLTHVFHFSLPDDKSYYTHRSGRTARAGKTGMSIAFVDPAEKRRLHFLEDRLHITFEQLLIPSGKDIASIRIEQACMQLLDARSKGKIHGEVLERALLLFGNLSKEELVKKWLSTEMERMGLTDSKDINASIFYNSKSKSSRGKRKHRGAQRGKSKPWKKKKGRKR
ncbi:MAG: DEAD/DEAH box helicase [Saprospiraceae bacterium]|nr:DEAD/DEAH box helicase [Saprospiraceae bacterium]